MRDCVVGEEFDEDFQEVLEETCSLVEKDRDGHDRWKSVELCSSSCFQFCGQTSIPVRSDQMSQVSKAAVASKSPC